MPTNRTFTAMQDLFILLLCCITVQYSVLATGVGNSLNHKFYFLKINSVPMVWNSWRAKILWLTSWNCGCVAERDLVYLEANLYVVEMNALLALVHGYHFKWALNCLLCVPLHRCSSALLVLYTSLLLVVHCLCVPVRCLLCVPLK